MTKELYLQEDPANVGDFLVDSDDNAYDLKDKTAYKCQFCNNQLKSNEGWLFYW